MSKDQRIKRIKERSTRILKIMHERNPSLQISASDSEQDTKEVMKQFFESHNTVMPTFFLPNKTFQKFIADTEYMFAHNVDSNLSAREALNYGKLVTLVINAKAALLANSIINTQNDLGREAESVVKYQSDIADGGYDRRQTQISLNLFWRFPDNKEVPRLDEKFQKYAKDLSSDDAEREKKAMEGMAQHVYDTLTTIDRTTDSAKKSQLEKLTYEMACSSPVELNATQAEICAERIIRKSKQAMQKSQGQEIGAVQEILYAIKDTIYDFFSAKEAIKVRNALEKQALDKIIPKIAKNAEQEQKNRSGGIMRDMFPTSKQDVSPPQTPTQVNRAAPHKKNAWQNL